MKEGVSQSCALSPLFASFVVARLLEPIDSLLRDRVVKRLASGDSGDEGFDGISHLLGYVDDISSCFYLHDLPFLCTSLIWRQRHRNDGANASPTMANTPAQRG